MEVVKETTFGTKVA